MAEIKFKLDEGVLGYLGSELGKLLLAPIAGSQGTDALYNKIKDKYNKSKIYTIEQDIKESKKKMIDGHIGLLKATKVRVNFDKDPLNIHEMDLLKDAIYKFYQSKEDLYRKEAKRALEHGHKIPTDILDSKKLAHEFSNIISKEIDSKYKSKKLDYLGIYNWYKDGYPMFGTTLPKQVASGITQLSLEWNYLETRMNKAKG